MIVTVIMGLLLSFGFNHYSRTFIVSGALQDRQYLLALLIKLEDYHVKHARYPEKLSSALALPQSELSAPNGYYRLNYRLISPNDYEIKALINQDKANTDWIECRQLSLSPSGKLTAWNQAATEISSQCWKK